MTQHHGPGKMRRAICPICGREVAVYRPTAGPRSGDVYRSHKTTSGSKQDCEGWAMAVAPDAYVGGAS